MDLKIFSWIASLALVAVLLAIFLPGGPAPDSKPALPWKIEVDQQGNPSVFDLKLGESTLLDARRQFKDWGHTSLFITQNNKPSVEAYFEQIVLSGLRGDIILVLEADEATLTGLYDRGERISRTTEITRKVELTGKDDDLVNSLPIRSITYIPTANLDESLLIERFGVPEKRIAEADTGIVHWIYPRLGLSIGVNRVGKELLQYMSLPALERFTQDLKAGKGGEGN